MYLGRPRPSLRWPIGSEVSIGPDRGVIVGYPGVYSVTIRTSKGLVSGGTELIPDDEDLERLADKALE